MLYEVITEFDPDTQIHHTHQGSIGNLMNAEIESKFDEIVQGFNRANVEKAQQELLK